MPPAATASSPGAAQRTARSTQDAVARGEVGRLVSNLETLATALTKLFAQATHGAATSREKSKADPEMPLSDTIARLCKYTDTVLSRAFGSNATKTQTKSTKPANERVSKREIATAEPETEEITEHEAAITPFDTKFDALQSELRKLLEKAEGDYLNFERLVIDNEATSSALNKLEDRTLHRAARARVRHIRFIATLEEEWTVDADSTCHCPPDPNAKMARCCDAP